MTKNTKSIISLTAICMTVALLMALTNMITLPTIQHNEQLAVEKSLLEVMPSGEGFEKIESLKGYDLPKTVTSVYKEKNGGYVVELLTTGYSSGLKILCGISKEGCVTGAVCLASTETLGYEESYGEEFVGTTKVSVEYVDTVSGATKTTAAYKNAVKDAILTAGILKGEGK